MSGRQYRQLKRQQRIQEAGLIAWRSDLKRIIHSIQALNHSTRLTRILRLLRLLPSRKELNEAGWIV